MQTVSNIAWNGSIRPGEDFLSIWAIIFCIFATQKGRMHSDVFSFYGKVIFQRVFYWNTLWSSICYVHVQQQQELKVQTCHLMVSVMSVFKEVWIGLSLTTKNWRQMQSACKVCFSGFRNESDGRTIKISNFLLEGQWK